MEGDMARMTPGRGQAVDTGSGQHAGADYTPKPRLRGWLHAGAAVAALAITIVLLRRPQDDPLRRAALLVFGLSMVELYTVSAIYHIGTWSAQRQRVLRALDHSNIFVLIAGTYTPICAAVLTGWLRTTVLLLIWALAVLGVGSAVLARRLPRWVGTALYIAMGWLALATFPALSARLPWQALALLVLGGVLYTLGGVIYARRRPDPWPQVFGFHELFHLFTIAGGAAFVIVVWVWVVPVGSL
jgi:hemolysin III